jgi:small subunit ribosomal protein S5
MIKAAFRALESMMSPRAVAARRGLKVADIIGRRGVQDSVGGGGGEEAETAEAEAENG